MQPNESSKTIVVLLSTYNGEKYLSEQIDSIINQTYTNWTLFIRDDGSTDNTLEIVNSYQQKNSRIQLISGISGQNLGANRSFGTLLEYAINNTSANYFMFSDQDDVWFSNKVELSLKGIKELERQTTMIMPCLVFADKVVVDNNLKIVFRSYFEYQKLYPNKISLNKLVIQNVPSACAMIFNKKLAELAVPIPKESIMHDHWLPLVASLLGKMNYINTPTMYYRQHSSNVFGANKYGFDMMLQKYKKGVNKARERLYNLSKQAEKLMETYSSKLTEQQIELLSDFATLPQRNWIDRRRILIKHKIYKSGFLRNIGLFIII